jgi:leucyl aminopeptidase
MRIKVRTNDPLATAADLLAIPMPRVARGERGAVRPTAGIRALDRALGGILTAALESGDFRGAAEQTALLYPRPAKGAKGAKADAGHVKRVLLVGLGKEDELTAEALRRAAGTAVRRGGNGRNKHISFWLPALRGVTPEAAAQAAAEGGVLGGYRFDGYRELGEADPGSVSAFTLFLEDDVSVQAARRAAERGRIVAESQNLARDLSNEPGNELPPSRLASEARRVAREEGLRCQVMGVPELKRLRMGGILAVGGGSAHPPRLIVLEHKPKKKAGPTICLVGKGITFDSGGISIKPSAGMEEMKHDMSGAAAVIGAMRGVAQLALPLHVVGVIGSAENLPSGTAYRPGDVVRTASGKTIEVLNTDAEGRVVLADALHYARTRFEPEAMIDLATLTGACMVALGPWASGLFGNDEKLGERIRAAGEASGERAWSMPLLPEHRRAVKSTIADVKNSGGREGGASTAAAFLSHFVGETPWAHLDIAGTGWTSTPHPYQIRGATGVGVRLLLELLRGW